MVNPTYEEGGQLDALLDKLDNMLDWGFRGTTTLTLPLHSESFVLDFFVHNFLTFRAKVTNVWRNHVNVKSLYDHLIHAFSWVKVVISALG